MIEMANKPELARKGEDANAWAERLEPTTDVCKLEQSGKVALYQLKDKASYNDPHGREPLYAVWVGKKMVHCMPGYIWGWKAYEREVNGK